MHWILALTLINTGSSTLMGSYESEEACKKAMNTLWSIVDPKKPISVGCMPEDSPILKIFER